MHFYTGLPLYVRPAEQATLSPECQGGFASLRSEQETASLALAAIPAHTMSGKVCQTILSIVSLLGSQKKPPSDEGGGFAEGEDGGRE